MKASEIKKSADPDAHFDNFRFVEVVSIARSAKLVEQVSKNRGKL